MGELGHETRDVRLVGNGLGAHAMPEALKIERAMGINEHERATSDGEEMRGIGAIPHRGERRGEVGVERDNVHGVREGWEC